MTLYITSNPEPWVTMQPPQPTSRLIVIYWSSAFFSFYTQQKDKISHSDIFLREELMLYETKLKEKEAHEATTIMCRVYAFLSDQCSSQ